MTTPICDASMQKRKKKKEKKKKKDSTEVFNSLPYRCPLGQHWVRKHIFISAKKFHMFVRLILKGIDVLVL